MSVTFMPAPPAAGPVEWGASIVCAAHPPQDRRLFADYETARAGLADHDRFCTDPDCGEHAYRPFVVVHSSTDTEPSLDVSVRNAMLLLRALGLVAELGADDVHEPPPGDTPAPAPGDDDVTRTRAGIQLVARTARADAQITEQRYGISLHNPFTDPAVTAAALAVPGHLRAGPGDYKPLLRHAMTGLLPSMVAQRRTKGDFTADQYRGLRAHLEGLHQLADGRLAEQGLLDPDRYRALLTRAAAGAPGIGFHQLNPVLATEVWLHAIATRPGGGLGPPPPPPAPPRAVAGGAR